MRKWLKNYVNMICHDRKRVEPVNLAISVVQALRYLICDSFITQPEGSASSTIQNRFKFSKPITLKILLAARVMRGIYLSQLGEPLPAFVPLRNDVLWKGTGETEGDEEYCARWLNMRKVAAIR